MKQNNLVSVIVPVYNAVPYLYKCVNSILNQTFDQVEIILINDGSTDNSVEICHTLATKDSRVNVINQHNQGPSAARNRGIEEASGEFIQFVDADDVIEETMTEKLVEAIGITNDLVLCGYVSKNKQQEERIVPSITGIFARNDFYDYVGKLYYDILLPSPCNKLYRTDLIKQNNIQFQIDVQLGEDLLFNLDYLNASQSIHVIQEPLYVYQHNDASLSKQVHENYFENQLMLLESVKLFLCEQDAYSSKNKNFIHKIFTQSVINSLTQLFYKNKDEKLAVQIEIGHTINHPEIQKHLPYFKGSIQARLIGFLIKFQLSRTLYLILRLKQTIHTRSKPLFNVLKKINSTCKTSL